MSATGLYKPGQGYWTRVGSAIGLAAVVFMGVAWLWQILATQRLFGLTEIYGQAGVAVLLLAAAGALGYWLIGLKPSVVEFMIATESEMKKVNWSTKKEIIGSTWLVIGLTVFLAFVCFAFDSSFQWFFQVIHVLETKSKGL